MLWFQLSLQMHFARVGYIHSIFILQKQTIIIIKSLLLGNTDMGPIAPQSCIRCWEFIDGKCRRVCSLRK